MKLLFDEHFSFRSVKALLDHFPGSHHLKFHNLENADDARIWYFAAKEGYAIITKDDDFHQRALALGSPPKVIWVKAENMRRNELEEFILQKQDEIRAFESREESLLVLQKVD